MSEQFETNLTLEQALIGAVERVAKPREIYREMSLQASGVRTLA